MEDFGELLRLRLDVEQYHGFLTTSEQKAANEAQGRYARARDAIAYGLLKRHPEPETATAAMRAGMAAERPGTPEHLLWLMDEVEEDLASRLVALGARKPWLRTLIHRGPLIALATAALGYVGLRFYCLLPLDAPPASREGIVQRAAAAPKVLRHARWTDTSRRRFVAEILAWPIQPTDEEQRAAAEFAGLVLGARDEMARAKLICGAPAPSAATSVEEADLDVIDTVAADLRAPGRKWATPPALTVLDPIRKAYPCP
jgi:hypothetical protein